MNKVSDGFTECKRVSKEFLSEQIVRLEKIIRIKKGLGYQTIDLVDELSDLAIFKDQVEKCEQKKYF